MVCSHEGTEAMDSLAQNGEDVVLYKLLQRIGVRFGVAVEIGAMPGYRYSNIRAIPGLVKQYVDCEDHGYNTVCRVTTENVDELLASLTEQKDFALLSIDIDGNDYWIWRAIKNHAPDVVIIEMNPSLSGKKTVKYDPDLVFKNTNYFGASFDALVALGWAKGYLPYFCNGGNIIFVHRRHHATVIPLPTVGYKPRRGWPLEKERRFVDV